MEKWQGLSVENWFRSFSAIVEGGLLSIKNPFEKGMLNILSALTALLLIRIIDFRLINFRSHIAAHFSLFY